MGRKQRPSKRKRFRFRPVPQPPPPPVDYTALAQRLVDAMQGMEKAYADLREVAEQIAGISMDDWDTKQILRYVDGFLRTHKDTP